MRNLYLSLLFIIPALFANAQKSLNTNEFQNLILQSFNDIFSAWKLDKIDQYYAKDFQILEDGLIWNKDSLYTYLKRRIDSGKKIERKNKIDVVEFNTVRNTAWGSYYNYAEIKLDDTKVRNVRWLESVVLIKQNGIWKIKLLHSTKIH
jgi:hypothetical protein